MVGTMRLVYAAAAWLFVGAVVVQVFLAGLGLFAGAKNFDLHAFFGFTVVHLISLLLVILGALGRVGRRNMWLGVLLFVLIGVQVSLPGLRTDLPLAAAIHPVNALLIFWLGAAHRLTGKARHRGAIGRGEADTSRTHSHGTVTCFGAARWATATTA
jgi:hypothetical protein